MTPKQIISILQSQVEAAERENNKLREVVKSHIKDLEQCVPTLREFDMNATAHEFEVAISELNAAIAKP